jgi:AP endonuclease-1
VKQFDEVIGLKYLCGMHMNDSKTLLGSKKDRHENIGLYVSSSYPLPSFLDFLLHPVPLHAHLFPSRGTLGIPAFSSILTDPRIQNIPLILETPSFEKPKEVWGVEISVLNRLSDGAGGLEASEDGEEPGDKMKSPSAEVDSEKLVEEVREAVKSVNKTTVKPKPKVAKGTGSRKRKSARDEDDEDEEGSECDG